MNLAKINTWTTPKVIAAVTLSGVLLLALGTYAKRTTLQQWWYESNEETVPVAIGFDDIDASTGSAQEIAVQNADLRSPQEDVPTPDDIIEPTLPAKPIEVPDPWNPPDTVPNSINLAIPFTSQAPQANWELPYAETCEEASALMAARFLQGRGIADANDADQAILQLVDYGTNTLGLPIDTTAEQTATIIEGFYELTTKVEPFDWLTVKQALAQGYPVLVPAAGQQLGNPYFTAPGPPYHMLVIKGYTGNTVITNDPGTRNGADYQYSFLTFESAVHDWNGGNVTAGEKVMIIVMPANS